VAEKTETRYALIGAHLNRSEAEGVEGITVLAAEPLFLSAIAFDSGRGPADADTIRRALAARTALTQRATFIAIRYGLSVSGEEEARSRCAPKLQRWRKILEERKGLIEVTLRIAAEEKAQRPDRTVFESGSEYLRALHQSRASRIDEATRSRFEEPFRAFALESRWLDRSDGGSELVLLIRREDLDRARVAGQTLQQASPETPFMLSGPWPLETFADEG